MFNNDSLHPHYRYKDYYDRPWEITADIMGGVSRPHNTKNIDKG